MEVRDDEGPIFAAEETGGVKCLQFLAFTIIEALADVDEGGYRRVQRAKGSRNDGAEMRRSHGLRGRVPRMPLILVARVQNETQIAGGVGSD